MTANPDVLDDYLDLVTYGFTNPMPDADHGPWKITAKDVIGGAINYGTARKTTQAAFENKLTEKSRPKIGDVLLTKDGTLGRLAIVDQDGICINQSVAVLRPNEKILPEYLFYLLSTPEYQRQMIGDSDGTVIKHIYISRVGKMEVNVPPVEDQRERLKHLLALDGKIELNRQTNQTLEEMAQAVFKSWFVDFDPTRAKIKAIENGQDPTRAAMAAIAGKTVDQLDTLSADQIKSLTATAALFPDALAPSDLGEIPKGWEVKPLSTWGDVICGKTPSKKNKEYYGGDVPFLKIPDMHGNMYAVKTSDCLSKLGANTQKKKIIPSGSICVSCIATVGLVTICCADSTTNQQINSIIPNSGIYTPYLYFTMLGLHDHFHDLASGGSATLNLNTGNFSKIETVRPEDAVLQRFYDFSKPTMNNILSNLYEQETLAQLRDTLLPRLLSGEIDVASLKGAAK